MRVLRHGIVEALEQVFVATGFRGEATGVTFPTQISVTAGCDFRMPIIGINAAVKRMGPGAIRRN